MSPIFVVTKMVVAWLVDGIVGVGALGIAGVGAVIIAGVGAVFGDPPAATCSIPHETRVPLLECTMNGRSFNIESSVIPVSTQPVKYPSPNSSVE
jgi:hypothetical protein